MNASVNTSTAKMRALRETNLSRSLGIRERWEYDDDEEAVRNDGEVSTERLLDKVNAAPHWGR